MCKVQRGQSQKTATFSKLKLEYSIFLFDDGKIKRGGTWIVVQKSKLLSQYEHQHLFRSMQQF